MRKQPLSDSAPAPFLIPHQPIQRHKGQNMKRHTILGTLAALALAAIPFVAVTPAQAAVGCNNVDNQLGYPHGSFTKYCGMAGLSNGQTMLNAISQTHGSASGEMPTAYNGSQPGVVFYLFHTPAEYAQNFPASGGNPVPGTNDFGVTKFDSANRPVFSAIFEINSALKTNAFIGSTSDHEVGRSIDALMGYVMNGGVVKTPYQNISND